MGIINSLDGRMSMNKVRAINIKNAMGKLNILVNENYTNLYDVFEINQNESVDELRTFCENEMLKLRENTDPKSKLEKLLLSEAVLVFETVNSKDEYDVSMNFAKGKVNEEANLVLSGEEKTDDKRSYSKNIIIIPIIIIILWIAAIAYNYDDMIEFLSQPKEVENEIKASEKEKNIMNLIKKYEKAAELGIQLL